MGLFRTSATTGTGFVRRRRRGRSAQSTTSIVDEYRMRGLSSAYRLLRAKLAFLAARNTVMDQFANMLRIGLTELDSVNNLKNEATYRGKNPRAALAYVYDDWKMRIQTGMELSETTAGWLPKDARPLIEAGERAAAVPEAIDFWLWMESVKAEQRSIVRVGLWAPGINVLLIVVYLWVMAYEMTPVFAQAVPRNQWKGTLWMIGFLSDAVRDHLITITAVIGVTTVFMMWSMNHLLGKWRVKLDSLPPWSLYRRLIGTSFMLSYSALHRSGEKDPDIMRILLRNARPYYAERLNAILDHVKSGDDIGTALMKTNQDFPDRTIAGNMMTYQRLPNFSAKMEQITKDWTRRNLKSLKRSVGVVAIILTAIATAVVLIMTLSSFEFVTAVQTTTRAALRTH